MNTINLTAFVNRCSQLIHSAKPFQGIITECSSRLKVCSSSSISRTSHLRHRWDKNIGLYRLSKPWRCEQVLLLKSFHKGHVQCQGFKSQAGQGGGTVQIALWKRLAVVASVGGIVAYIIYSVRRDREIRQEQVRYEEFKKAELGGDWTLTDHHGKERSSTEFRGQWILMYFGFTHCPDICPEELEKLVEIVKAFDNNPKLPSMTPLFITLDPERDTPSVIKDYLTEFKCPRLLGFTAPEATIREVATRYRAYFSKGLPDEDNDYIVDHTIIIYLVNPNGEFVNYFDRSRTAERIIKTVTEHIDKFNEMEGKKK